MAAIRLANALSRTSNKIHFIELESPNTSSAAQRKEISSEITLYRPDRQWQLISMKKLGFLFPWWKKSWKNIYASIKAKLVKRYLQRYQIEVINTHYIFTDEYFGYHKQNNQKIVASFHGHYELFDHSFLGEGYRERIEGILKNLDHIVITQA